MKRTIGRRRLATWDRWIARLDSMWAQRGAGRYSEQSDDLESVVEGYLDIALMLADGQQRSERVASPGARPRPPSCAARLGSPRPHALLPQHARHVSATLGISKDPPRPTVTLTQHVLKELDSHAQRSVIALDLGRAREALAEWQRGPRPATPGSVEWRASPSRTRRTGSRDSSLSRSLHGLRRLTVRLAPGAAAPTDGPHRERMRITVGITVATLMGLGDSGYLSGSIP